MDQEEIKKLKEELEKLQFRLGYLNCLQDLLLFIESLESEVVTAETIGQWTRDKREGLKEGI